jgi:hypothetical protein
MSRSKEITRLKWLRICQAALNAQMPPELVVAVGLVLLIFHYHAPWSSSRDDRESVSSGSRVLGSR